VDLIDRREGADGAALADPGERAVALSAIAVTLTKDSARRSGVVAAAVAVVLPVCRSTSLTVEESVSTPISAVSTPA
jgi:hypothetical protein